MIIHALHKNGYLYNYNTEDDGDIELWFEGRSIDDITKAFRMDVTTSPSDYASVGMEVMLQYIDGYMHGLRDSNKTK